MSYPHIITQRRGNHNEILYLVLHNPSALNALTTQMQIDLVRELKKAGLDRTVRAIVLRGEGDRAFSSGGSMESLKELDSPEACEAMYQRGVDIRETIAVMDKPVIAAVNGYCIGGGFEIAMCCDMVYASEDARFGLTEVNIGLVPGWGGAIRLPRKVTVNQAKEMILLGEKIDAQTARNWGIVNRIFPKGELYQRVDEIIDRLVEKPPLAIRGVKAIVNHGVVDGDIEAAKAIEHRLSVYLMSTQDFHEAVDAFREKRTPQFQGK